MPAFSPPAPASTDQNKDEELDGDCDGGDDGVAGDDGDENDEGEGDGVDIIDVGEG